jgi:hypothetical protein
MFAAANLRADAMPVFAEAYGYDCQKCHVQVPALNSYGRYVQRTMYAALDRETLKATAPVWIGEQPFYDSKDPNLPHRTQFGNVAVHLSGFLAPDVTTHIQQFLAQNDQPGGVDTAWVSYNDVLKAKNTHLVVGKMPPPGPSFFSQWMDLASFAAPQNAIGEHASALSRNRWGIKGGWSTTRFTADVGWFGANGDLNGATDFSSDTDKSIQWNIAYAPYDRPLQLGLYGNRGTFPLSAGGVDQYAATGLYVQLDQTRHAPGVLLTYQRGWDGNAGAGATTGTVLGPAASSGTTLELFYQPLRHYEGLISVRHESTSDGFGSVTQTNNIDLNFRLARFVHATLEQYTQSLQKPGFRYQVWWTTPLQRAH